MACCIDTIIGLSSLINVITITNGGGICSTCRFRPIDIWTHFITSVRSRCDRESHVLFLHMIWLNVYRSARLSTWGGFEENSILCRESIPTRWSLKSVIIVLDAVCSNSITCYLVTIGGSTCRISKCHGVSVRSIVLDYIWGVSSGQGGTISHTTNYQICRASYKERIRILRVWKFKVAPPTGGWKKIISIGKNVDINFVLLFNRDILRYKFEFSSSSDLYSIIEPIGLSLYTMSIGWRFW